MFVFSIMSLAETKIFISNIIDSSPSITNKDLVKSKLGIECERRAEKPHWFITIALPNDRDPVEMVYITLLTEPTSTNRVQATANL